jgi:hypothetical protein
MMDGQSTSPEPFGHSLLDLLVGNQFAGVGLLEAPLNLGQEEQPLHGVLQGRIVGQSLHRLNSFLFRRHSFSISERAGQFNGMSGIEVGLVLVIHGGSQIGLTTRVGCGINGRVVSLVQPHSPDVWSSLEAA